MAVEIVHDRQKRVACLYCNTSDLAFGPIFTGPGCAEDAEDFLVWLASSPDRTLMQPHGIDGTDARDYTAFGLTTMYHRWTQAIDKHRGVEDACA